MISSLAFSLFPLGFSQGNPDLPVVFGFLLGIVLIRSFFGWRRQKLWHETARLALEKGQPLPSDDSDCRGHRRVDGRSRGAGRMAGGAILIAVGLGLHFVNPPGLDRWWLVPLFVGIAQLIVGLFFYLRRANHRSEPGDRVNHPGESS